MAALVSSLESEMLLLVAAFVAGACLVGLWLYLLYRSRQHRLSQQWAQQQQALVQQFQGAESRVAELQGQNTALAIELSGSREKVNGLLRIEPQLRQREQQLDQLKNRNSELETEAAELQVRYQAQQQHHAEMLSMLEQTREQLQQQFGQLAQQVFEDNSQKFGTQQQEKMQHLLQPLREQLGDFRRRVDDVYDKEARDRQGLAEQIVQLKQLNLKMSEDALNLTNALKGDNKAQGNWGELILERVLEESGLRRGYEYEVQLSTKDSAGRRFQPDVVIHLPDQKDIVVDAKVSLVAYERYCSSDNDDERQLALREHVGSVKRHVKALSDKAYEGLPGIRSLDFVLLFIPVEAAFLTAIENDRQLFGDAFDSNILLVSPSTLLVTLRTINNIWRYEKQNLNAQDIARRGGELYDKFVGFVDALDEVGRHLDQTQRAYDTAMGRLSTGKGNLISRATTLKQLGLRSKKSLPQAMVERSQDSSDQSSSSVSAVKSLDESC
ncbi:MAG: DNA recombination protein RmuC [Motiliproteus sp.]